MVLENQGLKFSLNMIEDALRFLEDVYLNHGESVFLRFANDDVMDVFNAYISNFRRHNYSETQLFRNSPISKCITRQRYHGGELHLINADCYLELVSTSQVYSLKATAYSDSDIIQTEEYYCGIKIERFEDFIANPVLWYAEMEQNCSDDDCEDSISKELDEFLSSFENNNKKENANGENDPVQQMR